MLVSRLLLFCFATLVAAQEVRAAPRVATPPGESSEGRTREADDGAAVPPVATPPGESSKSRVATEPSIKFSSVHVDGPYVAMTFDDGPSATLTPKLLDLLAAHNIKATFFVIGENVAQHPDIVARAAREGHEIANHTWSHPNLAKLSDESVRRQLWRTDDAILSATGTRPTLLRPPYGSITEREKRWIHDEFGYHIILWDVDPYDWKRPGPAVVRNRILQETRPGSIVLSHDIHLGTIEAMPSTFDALTAKGFKFVTVSELIQLAVTQPARPRPAAPESARAASTPLPSTSPVSSPSSQAIRPSGMTNDK